MFSLNILDGKTRICLQLLCWNLISVYIIVTICSWQEMVASVFEEQLLLAKMCTQSSSKKLQSHSQQMKGTLCQEKLWQCIYIKFLSTAAECWRKIERKLTEIFITFLYNLVTYEGRQQFHIQAIYLELVQNSEY